METQPESRPILVLTTTDTPESARSIAQALLEKRLAACVQVSAIESHYRWKGELAADSEQRLLIKTTADRFAALEEQVLAMHTYDLPALVAVEIDNAHGPFLDWIRAESQP